MPSSVEGVFGGEDWRSKVCVSGRRGEDERLPAIPGWVAEEGIEKGWQGNKSLVCFVSSLIYRESEISQTGDALGGDGIRRVQAGAEGEGLFAIWRGDDALQQLADDPIGLRPAGGTAEPSLKGWSYPSLIPSLASCLCSAELECQFGC